MTIQNGFFKSINGDRKYLAEFFTSYFASFIGNGVFPNPSTNLQVIANQNFATIVRPGKGWINGHYLNNDADIVINHQPPDGVLRRIDRIVFAVNFDSRSMDIYLKQGTPATNAQAPTLLRTATIYELALADISFNPGMTSISQSNITDQRMNKALCGIVHGVVEQLDTTTLFNQYQQFLVEKGVEFDQQLAVNQQVFDDWFAQLNDILDGDVAANLANMIITHTNNATSQKHIEVVSTIPTNLANKGLLLQIDDVDNPNNAPEVPTSMILNARIDSVAQQLAQNETKLAGFINVSQFGTFVENGEVVGNNTTLQLAIDSARQAFIDNGGRKVQEIHLQSGVYELYDTVILSPYVKLKSLGAVIFKIMDNITGIHITARPDDPQFFGNSPTFLYKNSWNRGCYLDGRNGAFIFTSDIPLAESSVIGLEVGSRESYTAFRPTSRYVISHCAFYNIDTSIKMNVYHNFIGTFEQIHSENVNHHMIYGNTTEVAVDSGENFVFIGGVFAGAKKEGFIFNVGGADFSFNNISFDFNADKIFNPRASGNYIRLNACYFEVVQEEGVIYHCQPRSANETTGRNGLYFNDVIGLFRQSRKLITNDMFGGARIDLSVNISGLEIRFITSYVTDFKPLDKAFFLDSSENITLFAKNFVLQNTQRVALDKNLNFLANNDFSLSTLGNITSSSDSYWSANYGNCSGVIAENGVGGSKSIDVTLSGTGTSNYIRLDTKEFYSAKPGQVLSIFGSVLIAETSRTTQINGGVVCYDNNGNNLGTLQQYGTLTSSTTVISSGGYYSYPLIIPKIKLPKGTAKIKPFFSVANANMNYKINDVVAILEG